MGSLPAPIAQLQASIGESARARVDLLETKMNELHFRGDIKPATILNMSPFVLDLNSVLIPHKIPAVPKGKKFSTTIVETCRNYPIFKGNQEMSDKSLRAKWEVNVILPVMQVMEFRHYYMGETEDEEGTKQGGVIVFEGEFEELKPTTKVRAPYFIFQKRNRYITYKEAELGDLCVHAERVMKLKCMNVLDEAMRQYDLGNQHRANIQKPEHMWHDFALEKGWIKTAMPWRNTQPGNVDNRCPRCQDPYLSKTGVCKCSYVVDPLTAYLSGEILVDHVRMNTLSAAQWAKVKDEQKKRDEARA